MTLIRTLAARNHVIEHMDGQEAFVLVEYLECDD